MRFLVILTTLTLLSCSDDKWEGFVYPKKDNLIDYIKIGDYKSLEECRLALYMHIDAYDLNDADFECALNCKQSFNELKICEETSR